MSTEIYSLRIPKKLKEALKQLDDVNWQEEVRAFLEQETREEYLRKQLSEARKLRAKMKQTISSADIIREDRENVH